MTQTQGKRNTQRCGHCFRLEQEISVLKAREQTMAERLDKLLPTIKRLVNKERGELAWKWLGEQRDHARQPRRNYR